MQVDRLTFLKIGHRTESMSYIRLSRAGLFLIALVVTQQTPAVRCDAKEFDWGELGVSLANSKASLSNGSGSANNLRILVSPQRRMTKSGYEYEYTTNNTQPMGSSGGQSESASYVLPGSANTYLTQSALAPNHSGHSAAYSALSASLASLKNRLNARGVTLSSSLADGVPQPGLYSNAAYSSSLLAGSDGSQQHGGSVVGSAVSSAQQPTYLSVSNQQDSQSSSLYTVQPNQTNDSNKTIVLAIPAKINFLTGSKQQQQQLQQQQQQQQQSQQPQQLTVIQSPSSEQQARPEAYATKQQLDGQVIDQSNQLGSPNDQEQRQYVIVNSSPSQSTDYHSHSVAANLSPSSVHNGQIYSSAVYQAAPTSASSGPSGQSYTMKYIPTYQQVAPAVPMQQQQTIQKVYSVVAAEPQPMLSQPPPPGTTYEQQQVVEQQPATSTSGRYSHNGCLDTCNSADPRWRKYTISKYKYCCSRSAQYDSSLIEQPSADKVGDVSSKYTDDAYYSYLYRKSRARRSRRQRARYSGRYPASSNQNEEDAYESSTGGDSNSAVPSSGRANGVANRGLYSYEASPSYPKYYSKNRNAYQQQSAQSEQSNAEDAPVPTGSSKYSAKEPRSYRRGRGREYTDVPAQSQADSQQTGPANSESGEEVEGPSVYPPQRGNGNSASSGAGYGSGDYSVDSLSQYSPPDSFRGHGPLPLNEEEDTQARGYDEAPDSEPGKDGDDPSGVDSMGAEGSLEESSGEIETAGGYKYPTSTGSRRRKPAQQNKSAPRRKQSKYYKKNRKNRYGGKLDHSTSQTNNGTSDYELAQPGEYNHHGHSDSQNGNSNEEEQGPTYSSSSSSKDNSNENQEAEKESLASKYKASINETAVANLSKTTMHLKEILSLLEKKAQLRGNDSAPSQASSINSPSPVTSTPTPITTTTSLYPLSSLFSAGSPYASPLSSDYLTSELSLKSPYRYESSLSSPLSSSLSLPSSYGSLGSDSFSSVLSSYPSHGYGLHSAKPLPMPTTNPHHQRKRRPSKNMNRYSDLMLHKSHGLSPAMSSSLFHNAAAKNRFLHQAYYPTLQHPYLYRGSSPSITNPYPYKNVHKNSYSSLFNGPVSSKLATTAAGLYSDESRLHGLTSSYDPLAHVASSLRPTSTMRLRSKPFVFQPQVLPIYSRHTILTQPLDVKA